MTDEQLNEIRKTLAAIREREAKATPGPWNCWNGWQYDRETDTMAMQRIGPDGIYGKALATRDGYDLYATRADAEFVANAREDIPALLAEAQFLHRQLEIAHEMFGAAKVAEAKRLETVREIVQAVAEHDMVIYRDSDMWCIFACQGEIEASDEGTHYWRHTSDCPSTKARAWLVTQASETTAE